MTRTETHARERRWPRAVRVLLVSVVALATAFALIAVGSWLYAIRPQEVRVEAYAVKDSTTVLAEVLVGANDRFVAAYAEETPTTVILHVTTRNVPGSYPAIGLMASEEITLQAPIGTRKVRAFDGSRVPEVSLARIAKLSIDEAIAGSSAQVQSRRASRMAARARRRSRAASSPSPNRYHARQSSGSASTRARSASRKR